MSNEMIRHPKTIVSEVLEKLKEQIRAADPYGQNLVITDILALVDEAQRDPFVPGKFWAAEIRRRAISESTGFVAHQPVDCPHCEGPSKTCSLCRGLGQVSADTYLRYSIDPEYALANPNPIPPAKTGKASQQGAQPKILPIRR